MSVDAHRHSLKPQPRSLKQGTSAIGSEIFSSFERDIEDAIFETIDEDQNNRRAKIKETYKAQKPSFGKLDRNEADSSEVPKSGLNIFSKEVQSEKKSPFMSQLVLSLAICAFTIAAVLPIVWMLEPPEAADHIASEIKSFLPDASIATGSIEAMPETPQILNQDVLDSAILDKPNPIRHDKSSSLHAVGEGSVVKTSPEGSVIYFGSQD
jgi:hypothetical protein